MIKNPIYFIATLLGLSLVLSSCEDPIKVDNKFVEKEIVVDAWITNDGSDQTITLTYSQDYFDASPYEAIAEASVVVKNGDKTLNFENQGEGKFVYSGEKIGATGDEVSLHIQVGDAQIEARTTINRVPKTDSIAIIEEPKNSGEGVDLFAELFARDFVGVGDTYSIKTWKNDTLLLRPREIIVVYDCTFDAGSGLDGLNFIKPLRNGINARNEDGRPIPYNKGDKIYVELHSISNDAFGFLQSVAEQAANGDNTIFAIPINNSDGNVFIKGSKKRVLGFFNVANVSSIQKTVE